MKRLSCGALVVLMVTVSLCGAAPSPAIVPGVGDWTLETAFEHPRQITLRINGQVKRFWYVLVTLTNNTHRDVDLFAKCTLMTDSFQVVPAGGVGSSVVFGKLQKIYQGKYPFLESLEQAQCKILQGQDNTRDIAIIWPDFDAKAKNIKLFVTGLSNETIAIDHPTEKNGHGYPAKVYLRKTLELNYAIGGDPALRDNAQLLFKGKRWIMR
ncbi:MAG: hypothetical protein ACYST9_00040 [Planctomycetota bacterium]